jgi:hypothetical protein
MPQTPQPNHTSPDAYHARMRLLHRWRGIALISGALLALYAVLIYTRDPTLSHPADVVLIASLFAFIVALLVAVNFLTISYGK